MKKSLSLIISIAFSIVLAAHAAQAASQKIDVKLAEEFNSLVRNHHPNFDPWLRKLEMSTVDIKDPQISFAFGLLSSAAAARFVHLEGEGPIIKPEQQYQAAAVLNFALYGPFADSMNQVDQVNGYRNKVETRYARIKAALPPETQAMLTQKARQWARILERKPLFFDDFPGGPDTVAAQIHQIAEERDRIVVYKYGDIPIVAKPNDSVDSIKAQIMGQRSRNMSKANRKQFYQEATKAHTEFINNLRAEVHAIQFLPARSIEQIIPSLQDAAYRRLQQTIDAKDYLNLFHEAVQTLLHPVEIERFVKACYIDFFDKKHVLFTNEATAYYWEKAVSDTAQAKLERERQIIDQKAKTPARNISEILDSIRLVLESEPDKQFRSKSPESQFYLVAVNTITHPKEIALFVKNCPDPIIIAQFRTHEATEEIWRKAIVDELDLRDNQNPTVIDYSAYYPKEK